jgi:hypothetical protein
MWCVPALALTVEERDDGCRDLDEAAKKGSAWLFPRQFARILSMRTGAFDESRAVIWDQADMDELVVGLSAAVHHRAKNVWVSLGVTRSTKYGGGKADP